MLAADPPLGQITQLAKNVLGPIITGNLLGVAGAIVLTGADAIAGLRCLWLVGSHNEFGVLNGRKA
jgi:hypothetical protein